MINRLLNIIGKVFQLCISICSNVNCSPLVARGSNLYPVMNFLFQNLLLLSQSKSIRLKIFCCLSFSVLLLTQASIIQNSVHIQFLNIIFITLEFSYPFLIYELSFESISTIQFLFYFIDVLWILNNIFFNFVVIFMLFLSNFS